MSTAGLAAQQIYLPAETHLFRGGYCHSMAGAKPTWSHQHELDKWYFSPGASSLDYNFRLLQQVPPSLSVERQRPQPPPPHSPGAQQLPPKKFRPAQLTLATSAEPPSPGSAEEDQVVPSFSRLSVYDHRVSPPHTPGRAAKPLPPIPGSGNLSPDQAMDHEVEFFTSADDSCCLVPEPCPKASAFRYGTPNRRSFRGCGQINYAYFEGPGAQPKQQQQHQRRQEQEVAREVEEKQPEPEACPRPQERSQRKLRRSHSGPAGSFNKPTTLRLSCPRRHAQDPDKPQVPPRVPIPPRPVKGADYHRWSAEVSLGAYSDEDKPPKVPPRDPLSRVGSRTPSPKSLPTYQNGVMPPTQSFAPDPKYVSRALQRQHSEGSPCILPVMENGRKSSTTHYFLLPQRPAFLSSPCVERYLQDLDSPAGRGGETPGADWDLQARRKVQVDMV